MSENDDISAVQGHGSADRVSIKKPQISDTNGVEVRWSFQENIFFLFVFVVLTAALTWPAVFHLRDRIIGGFSGDNFHCLWEVWYVAHAVFDLHTSPFFDADIYVPFGFDLIKNQDLSPGTVLLFMPLTRLAGEVISYNVIILVSFALTGFGTFLLARELWHSRAGALLAGVGVGFCAYRFIHAEGHLATVSTQWIPFFFLYLEKTLRRPNLRNGAITGFFYALCALATWYYASAVPIAAVLYLLFRIRWWRDRQQVLPLVKPGLVAIAVAMVIVLPFAVPYAIAARTAMAPRTLTESQAFSASVADFFIPSIHHPLWGHWIRQHWRDGANGRWLSEWEVYLGGVLLSLAILGGFVWKDRRMIFVLLTLACGASVLAFGPSLYLVHPECVPGAENLAPLSPVTLPVSILNHIPPFSLLRAWSRMGFFVQLAVSLLAAAGLAYLLETLGRAHAAWRLLIISAVLGSTLLDGLAIPLGMQTVAPRAVDRWMAAQPEKFTVMEYPIQDHAYSGPAMYSTRLNGKRIVMGYASFPPNLAYWSTLSFFPAQVTLDLLQAWQTKYVLVDENLYRSGVEFWQLRQNWKSLQLAISAAPSLKEVQVLDGVHVYELLSMPPHFIGRELLHDPDFEADHDIDDEAWVAVGKPLIDKTGKQAHRGNGSCAVTSRDFLQSRRIPVQPGQCYYLSAFCRKAKRTSALFRLQIAWLDADGVELDPSTASIRVVKAEDAWQRAGDQFIAPDGSRFAVVYACAKAGKVWVDDYSLRQVDGGCQPVLEAIPNPVPVPPPPAEGRSAIHWDTHAGSTGQIFVSANGEPERLFAEGPAGSRLLDGIRSESTYRVILYEGKNHIPIKTITLIAGALMALTVDPSIVVTSGGVGKTVVTWDTFGAVKGEAVAGEVYVSQDGGAEQLFARNASGSQVASWIAPGSTYEFRLYIAGKPKRLLQKCVVKGSP